MQLSPVGILADVFWHEIRHHAQQVELGAFVVMPNHIHGILILNDAGNINGITIIATVSKSGQKHCFVDYWGI